MVRPIIPDDLRDEIAPPLPPPRLRPKGGRRPIVNRSALTGILFVRRSGLPWEMLSAEMGCGSARVAGVGYGIGRRQAYRAACPTSCWSTCTWRVRSIGARLAWTARLFRPKKGGCHRCKPDRPEQARHEASPRRRCPRHASGRRLNRGQCSRRYTINRHAAGDSPGALVPTRQSTPQTG